MPTPYPHEPIHGLSSIRIWALKGFTDHTQSVIITEDHGPSVGFENVIGNSTNAPLADGYTVSPINTVALEPMSESPYQSLLRREMETLFGTPNHAAVAASVPSIYAAPAGTEDRNTDTEAVQLAEAHSHLITTQTVHSCLATVPCQWTGEDNVNPTCGALITCKSAPAHLKETHSIRKIGRGTLIYCRWNGCDKWVTRQNFVRHTRECHLNRHPRKSE